MFKKQMTIIAYFIFMNIFTKYFEWLCMIDQYMLYMWILLVVKMEIYMSKL